VTIIQLAVILVLVSIVAVASVARSLDPAFDWAAALTLGAILAPPIRLRRCRRHNRSGFAERRKRFWKERGF
jgi:hypothetical protein